MAGGPDIVEIRNGQRAGHVFVIAAKLGIGAILLVGAAYRSCVGGGSAGQLAFLWLGGAAMLVVGAFHLRTALDRTVQLTLSPEGLRDRRSGGVLIPWASVRRISNHPGYGSASTSVHLELGDRLDVGRDLMTGSGTMIFNEKKVRVDIDALDTNARELIGHIKYFAPHVEVARPFAPRL